MVYSVWPWTVASPIVYSTTGWPFMADARYEPSVSWKSLLLSSGLMLKPPFPSCIIASSTIETAELTSSMSSALTSIAARAFVLAFICGAAKRCVRQSGGTAVRRAGVPGFGFWALGGGARGLNLDRDLCHEGKRLSNSALRILKRISPAAATYS